MSVPGWFQDVLDRRDTRSRQYHQAILLSAYLDPEERNFLKSQPTSFVLEPDAVDRLKEAGTRTLKKNPEFQQLLKDLR